MKLLQFICLCVFLFPLQGRGQEITLDNYMTFDRDSLQMLVDQGDLDAMCALGKVWAFAGDVDKTCQLWLQAAQKGHPESCFRLGILLSTQVVVRNVVDGAYWLIQSPYDVVGYLLPHLSTIRKAAEGLLASDIQRALYVWGKMNVLGICVPADVNYGVSLLEKSATMEAYDFLCTLYQNDEWGMKDWDKAIMYCQKGAELGDWEALSFLAYCKHHGHILKQDLDEALTLYLQVYENGVNYESHRSIGVSILYLIGTLYDDKRVKAYNPQLAIQYYTEAAERFRDCNAMFELAQISYKGLNGQPVDYKESVKWLFQASAESNKNGYTPISEIYGLLAACYRFGRGVNQDEKKAEEYDQKAIRLNNARQDRLRLLDMELPSPKPISIDMVAVTGGKLCIGATENQKRYADSNEYPSIEITVSNFAIGKYEITQKQWTDVMGYNPSEKKGDNLPVTNISWQEVQLFLERLNAVSGKKYRLPTEAEWEYAARGGQNSKGYYYIGSNNLDEVAWQDHSLHIVGQKSPNELGLYDMAGNVWECCADDLGGYGQYAGTDLVNPKGKGGIHVARRGGSSYYFEWGCRPAFRGGSTIGDVRDDTGFRVCSDLNDD